MQHPDPLYEANRQLDWLRRLSAVAFAIVMISTAAVLYFMVGKPSRLSATTQYPAALTAVGILLVAGVVTGLLVELTSRKRDEIYGSGE